MEPRKYWTGLLLPGERQSVEPRAARLAPGHVRRRQQSLPPGVAAAPWSEEALWAQGRGSVLPAREKPGPIPAWSGDDRGFVKKGKPSVGVARQYGGPVGTPENCRVAVPLSVAPAAASLPMAGRLYRPEEWAPEGERRKPTGVPEEIRFPTKPAIRTASGRRVAAGRARGRSRTHPGLAFDTAG